MLTKPLCCSSKPRAKSACSCEDYTIWQSPVHLVVEGEAPRTNLYPPPPLSSFSLSLIPDREKKSTPLSGVSPDEMNEWNHCEKTSWKFHLQLPPVGPPADTLRFLAFRLTRKSIDS